MIVERWAKISEWLPTSSKQVLAYMKSKGYQIPLHRKTKKPTSNNEALEKILRKHPEDQVIPLILASRDLQKADGYLSDKYVGRDGRFHPELTQHPKTLRFSSRAPNVTNLMKPDKFRGSTDPRKQAKALIAESIVGSIEASPGMVLIERDFKSQESLLLGYFAGDENYMRMARLGIYSYFLSFKVGQPVNLQQPDDVVKKELNAIKAAFPRQYPIMKKTILARGYGEGISAIAKDLEPFFLGDAKKKAEEMQSRRRDLVFELCSKMAKEAAAEYVRIYESSAPKVVAFQNAVRGRAHKERQLVNPFGYPLAFFDVMRPKKDPQGNYLRDSQGKLIAQAGSEFNEAVAFLPQSTGAGILKVCMLELDRRLGSDPTFNLLIPEHDKLVAECPEEKWEYYQSVMREVMEAPIKELGGLHIETEGKVGKNWGAMRDCA